MEETKMTEQTKQVTEVKGWVGIALAAIFIITYFVA
jgi:hypothetical protein